MHVTPETKTEVLPEGFRLTVHHFHDGNDPNGKTRQMIQQAVREEREYTGHKPIDIPAYASVAAITDQEGNRHGEGFSICMAGDTPNRRLGWEIAASRACEEFFQSKG